MDIAPVPPANISDLPEELVEYIIGLISPYQDLKNSSLVCKQWNRLVKGVTTKIIRSFNLATQTGKIKWTAIKVESGQTISKRYSHCACYYDKSLYVCSGCTVTNTTFNDIWRFDLTTRQWVRPLAVGAYPSPKGCASMVVYKDNLVLYGGWSHPTPYPLHQTSKFFSELDMFNPETNRWTHVCCMSQTPPPMAGHSASVIGDYMVVFGGSMAPGVGSNDVYIFDFIECVWRKEVITGGKPSPRYGQSQVTLDDNHILILGGCGGANQILSDVWLLLVTEYQAKWQEIKLENTEYAAPQLWCHPACMVDNCMVVLSKSAKPSTPPSPKPLLHRPVVPSRPSHYNPLLHEPGPSRSRFHEPDDSSSDDSASEEVNPTANNDGFVHPGEVGSLGTGGVRVGLPSVRPNSMSNRQKQLDALRKYEERFRASTSKQSPKRVVQETHRESRVAPMFLHVLDIKNVISSRTATWKPYHEVVTSDTPEETVFFSLVQGRGELIMFGGIEKDISSMQRGKSLESLSVSNTVHIVSAKDFKLG